MLCALLRWPKARGRPAGEMKADDASAQMHPTSRKAAKQKINLDIQCRGSEAIYSDMDSIISMFLRGSPNLRPPPFGGRGKFLPSMSTLACEKVEWHKLGGCLLK